MSVIVEKVTAGFDRQAVLRHISCEFEPGKLTALVGPSGSGKTTLLEVISGLLLPWSGTVRVEGDSAGLSPVVWVPQGANALGARSILDNVRLAPLSDGLSSAQATETASRMINYVGLGDRESSLARELSGGELQRLAFARAIASRRRVILADEPTANLDAANTEEIVCLLHRLRSDRTMIVATHDPNLVSAADSVVDLRLLGNHGPSQVASKAGSHE
jgi:ABC-type lipoprotein export system ATPase subunit